MGALRFTKKTCLPYEPLVVHPALKGYLGYCFVKSAMKLRDRIDRALEEHGLIAPMLGLLRVLRSGGPVSQIELGRAVGIDKATMVKFIDQMEKLKLVNRQEGSPDRRVKLVSLSKEGERKLARITKVRERAEEEFLFPLSAAEKKALRAILPKLLG